MAKYNFHYDPEDGGTVPEGRAALYIESLLNEAEKAGAIEVSFGQDLLISLVRLAVREGRIPHHEVLFHFNGEEIPVNQHGVISNWPVGFCEITTKVTTKLLMPKNVKDATSRSPFNSWMSGGNSQG